MNFLVTVVLYSFHRSGYGISFDNTHQKHCKENTKMEVCEKEIISAHLYCSM